MSGGYSRLRCHYDGGVGGGSLRLEVVTGLTRLVVVGRRRIGLSLRRELGGWLRGN